MTTPAMVIRMAVQTRRETRSPRKIRPMIPATNGDAATITTTLATLVCVRAVMKVI